ANEYALKLMPASKSLGLVVRKALWMGKGAPPQRAMSPDLGELGRVASSSSDAPAAVVNEATKEETTSTPACAPSTDPAPPVFPPLPSSLAADVEVPGPSAVPPSP